MDTVRTLEILRNAVGTGEIFLVRYHGGSSPGSTRKITPRLVPENGLVQCLCLTTHRVKLFDPARIEIIENVTGNEEDSWNGTEGRKRAQDSLFPAALEKFKDQISQTLEEVQCVIMIDDNKIGIHKIGKRGNPLKYPVISISRIMEDENGPRERPWSVYCKGNPSHHYKDSDKAFIMFLEFCKKNIGIMF